MKNRKLTRVNEKGPARGPEAEVKPPPRWWGYAAIPAAAAIVYRYVDVNAMPGAAPNPWYYLTAAVLLLAAWQTFLYQAFILLWLFWTAETEETDEDKDA